MGLLHSTGNFPMTTKSGNVKDAFDRVQRGLSGYISYLAACEMNKSFSEYILYEPILRILTASATRSIANSFAPGLQRPKGKRGDVPKIDFHVQGDGLHFAIEVKWAKKSKPLVKDNCVKLCTYKATIKNSACYLCVFGTQSVIEKLSFTEPDLSEVGKPVIARHETNEVRLPHLQLVAEKASG